MQFSGSGSAVTIGGQPISVTAAFGTPVFVRSAAVPNLNAQYGVETVLQAMAGASTFGATIVGTAGAGNKGIVEIQNPAASGQTLHVYSLDFWTAIAMNINVYVDGTTLAPAGVPVPLRIGGGPSVGKVGGGNQLAPTGTLFYASPSLAANTDYPIPQPWLLTIPAGHNLQLQGQTVNQAFTVNVRWVELIA